MNPLIVITMFLNIIFTIREFFAVWDHITLIKAQGRLPNPEDYFEFGFAGVLIAITFFTLCVTCFR